MTVEKFNRIAAAVTINVILLIVILAAVAVYQLVVIVNMRNAIRDIDGEIKRLEQHMEEEQSYLEWLESDAALQKAIQEQVMGKNRN